MHRMQKLDKIVMQKLNLLPIASTYQTLIEQLTEQASLSSAISSKFSSIDESIEKLHVAIDKLGDVQLVGGFSSDCDVKINEFTSIISEIDSKMADFANYIHENGKQSGVNIENLVAARIDTTEFLINLIGKLQDHKVIEDVDIRPLQDIKNNLQTGLDSVRQTGNYTVYQSNSKSGQINRFTSGQKY